MFTTYTQEILNCSKDDSSSVINTTEEELVEKYQLEKCVAWVRENNFEKTCLQFPEHLLNDGVSIALHLQRTLEKTFYILADTSYGSCCIDEVAAEHVNGDSIIHFGHACLSPVTKLPVLFIFEKKNLNFTKLKEKFQIFNTDPVVVFFSDVFHHLYEELCSTFEEDKNISMSRLLLEDFTSVDPDEKVSCGRIFKNQSNSSISAVYIGEDSITLQNLVLQLPDFKWYRFTEDADLVNCEFNRNKFFMQRSHLIEKVKEAKIVGILIATLGIKNYLDAVERIKMLVKQKGKKCYMLAVGKPNVAKLANFPEIDVFVCIACQEHSLLKNSKDYHKPVVSLYEVEMALGDRPFSAIYTSDFRGLLPSGSLYVWSDSNPNDSEDLTNFPEKTSQVLMERDPGTIIESTGSQFLSNRTWRGLEPKIGETEVSKATEGRTGIPQAYENELAALSEESNHN